MIMQAIQWSDDPNGPALTWTYLSLCATLGESVSEYYSLREHTDQIIPDRSDFVSDDMSVAEQLLNIN